MVTFTDFDRVDSNNVSVIVVRLTLNTEANALPAITFYIPDLVVSGGGGIQWFLDGAPITVATGSSRTPTQNDS